MSTEDFGRQRTNWTAWMTVVSPLDISGVEVLAWTHTPRADKKVEIVQEQRSARSHDRRIFGPISDILKFGAPFGSRRRRSAMDRSYDGCPRRKVL